MRYARTVKRPLDRRSLGTAVPLVPNAARWKCRRRPLFPFLTLFVLVVSLTVGTVAVRYLWPQESETDPGIIATSSQQDPFAALELCKELGVDTVLTSGQKNTCLEGLPLLEEHPLDLPHLPVLEKIPDLF